MQTGNKPKSISTATLRNRTQQQQQPDPSKIVITKAVRSGGRYDNREQPYNAAPLPPPSAAAPSQYRQSTFTIRGLANAGNGGGGMSIRGEAGPAIVVISNLDPAANAEDVRVSLL